MKKLAILFCFMSALFMTAEAQTCSKKLAASKGKSCAKTCTKKSAETKVASVIMEADEVAEKDASIEKKVCSKSGNVSYYRKNVCEKSGNVSMAEVSYDSESKQFVNVAPSSIEQAPDMMKASEGDDLKKACSKKGSKACCAKNSDKACCAKKADKAKAVAIPESGRTEKT